MKSAFYLFALPALLLVNTFVVQGQPPKLNSFQSSSATIFLDFDGQYVSGTAWNWVGDIDAQPSGLYNMDIMEIFNRVSEDYRPFNLNITTDSLVYLAAPFDKRMRLIITPTYEWYGQAGGISYVGSFTWGNETPAFVFSGLLNYNVKYVAEACSHEIGHTLGLQHQSTYDQNCNKTAEYNEGQGEGEIGWAPIMGLGYYKNLTTWSSGPNTISCTSIQSDLSIISGSPNDFGYRLDDHGDDIGVATNINMNGPSFNITGLINTPGDIDVFKLKIKSPTSFKLNATPQNVGWGNAGADIDIKITLKDSRSNTIGVYNPAMILNVGIDTGLNAGDYYIMVTGTGNINHSAYGSLGFYNLIASLGVALPVHDFVLRASTENSDHVLTWTYNSDEKIKNLTIETSVDGINFQELVILNASARTFSYQPFAASVYYRIKALTLADERAYYSNITQVKSVVLPPIQLISNMGYTSVLCNAKGQYGYQLFDNLGRLLQRGILVKGLNNINLRNAPVGILFLNISDGTKSWTERIIKQ